MLKGECGMMNSILPAFPPSKGVLFKQTRPGNVKPTRGGRLADGPVGVVHNRA